MLTGIAQLKKLRGKSMRELCVRGRQEIAKLCERAFGLGVGEMSDNDFLSHIGRDERSGSAQGTARSIVNRIQKSVSSSHSNLHTFFPSLARREQIASIMGWRFAREQRAIIARAERAMAGRFDLLGFAELNFGNPPDWLLEPVSGKRAPLVHWSRVDYLDPRVAGDKKITWELNRHQHFVTLGQAYWLTGDERYLKAFISQAVSWMDANPVGFGINWASSLELAFRSVSWLWALHLFADSLPASRVALRLLKHLISHGQHIESYLSSYFSPNTHLTGEALALFYLGTALPELRRAEEWRRLGLSVLLDQMSRQVCDDGVYFEQSTYYHRYTADFYTHLLILARASGATLPVEEKLAQLLTHLMWITRPDGSSPLAGDDDGGRLIILGERRLDDFRDTLAAGAALFGRGDWKHAAGDAGVEALWLLGPDGLASYDTLTALAPVETTHAFASGGYYVMRDGWSPTSSYALIACNPQPATNCAHAHADALAIEFAALGKNWLIDPGTYTYTADAQMRDRFRSTEAHNTVTVDDQPQSIPAGPFSWSHVASASMKEFICGDGFDYFAGSHDGYLRLNDPVQHTRAVICAKQSEDQPGDSLASYLIVNDDFAASSWHHYSIRYHLAPGCTALASGNRVIVTDSFGDKLNIIAFGKATPRARIEKGLVSRAYGHSEPALVAIFEASGEGPQQFTTFIVPALEDQSIRVESQQMNASRGFQ
ncbi:MAG TPA: alginate lyase family protein, partial [Blastocatellia bacterium]